MRIEDKLIRGLSVFNPDKAKTEGLLREESLDWEYFQNTCLSEGVGPLVDYNLGRLGVPELVPEQVREAFEKEGKANQAWSVVLMKEVKELLKRLHEADVEVIIMKGIRLLNELYPSISLRAMDDIDLLVQKRDVESAIDVMNQAGYKHFHSPRFVEGGGIEQGFKKEGVMGALVDLHYDLLPPGRQALDLEGIWVRSREVTLAGEPARYLSLEDEIIYHCARLASVDKFNSRLIHFVDLKEFVGKVNSGIDWGVIIESSRDQGLSTPVYVVLNLLKQWYEMNTPQWALRSLRPGPIRRAMFQLVFDHRALKPHPVQKRLKGIVIGLLLMDKYREWITYVIKYTLGSRH